MKMTEEDIAELKRTRPGVYVNEKCDHCGRPIMGLLSYRGHSPETLYCSRVCLEQAEFTLKGSKAMAIEKKMKKAEVPQVPNKAEKGSPQNKAAKPSKSEETPAPKKAKATKPEPEETPAPKKAKTPKPEPVPAPKKGKVSKSEPAEDSAPKKGKSAGPVPVPPKKGKTPKAKGSTPYREGSNFAKAFQTLQDAGKAITVEEMFAGLEAADPNRMLTHMIRRGDETGEFQIVRADGKVQMKKAYKG